MNVSVALDVAVPHITTMDYVGLIMIPILVIVIVILSIRGIIKEIRREKYGETGSRKGNSEDEELLEKRDVVLENGDWYCKDCGNLNSAKALFCSCGSKKSSENEEKE